MTDHPMSCYPGQFEPWKPSEMVTIPTLVQRSVMKESGIRAENCAHLANQAISRVMSGQITSITGGKP